MCLLSPVHLVAADIPKYSLSYLSLAGVGHGNNELESDLFPPDLDASPFPLVLSFPPIFFFAIFLMDVPIMFLPGDLPLSPWNTSSYKNKVLQAMFSSYVWKNSHCGWSFLFPMAHFLFLVPFNQTAALKRTL